MDDYKPYSHCCYRTSTGTIAWHYLAVISTITILRYAVSAQYVRIYMATLVRKRAILQPCRCAAIDRAKRVTLGIKRAKAGVGLIACRRMSFSTGSIMQSSLHTICTGTVSLTQKYVIFPHFGCYLDRKGLETCVACPAIMICTWMKVTICLFISHDKNSPRRPNPPGWLHIWTIWLHRSPVSK